ncbi:unnamed protein product [Owenia fusiformis]|uniref:Inositol hexakisphosphate and diphosphoinositol-pentakisphosphate kinase n=1 Tax=Owenia fusiformis TaxID=6347 RepID=A0A8J1UZ68_OWEFU|nr:unnamed protein product [Owenia fusiformis]
MANNIESGEVELSMSSETTKKESETSTSSKHPEVPNNIAFPVNDVTVSINKVSIPDEAKPNIARSTKSGNLGNIDINVTDTSGVIIDSSSNIKNKTFTQAKEDDISDTATDHSCSTKDSNSTLTDFADLNFHSPTDGPGLVVTDTSNQIDSSAIITDLTDNTKVYDEPQCQRHVHISAEAIKEESQDTGSRASFYLHDDFSVNDVDCNRRSNSSTPPERANVDGRRVIVGICAMKKKSSSRPMQEILERLELFQYIETLIFDEDVILKSPIEDWPICDGLISFFSKGFPLDKAVRYAKLRKPFLINDLKMQYFLQDRREVYKILEKEGIDQPRYAVLERDSDNPHKCELVQTEDSIEVNGVTFQKPFVEKPVSAEDHNVYIYFPTSAGGGSQRLFRKIGSRSSVYSPVSRIRQTGSYIYEDFMPTDGTDVKVYTLGPDYAHAEARKSPALDGKVERDKQGKEIRYPVILSASEKLIARKVCIAFKQTVCGFDLLRANGKSYVCDVNGFSFVKNSMKYYDDSAKILGNLVLRNLAPQLSIPWSITFQPEDIPIVPTTYGTMMELRCVIAVIRHGDRTPKQKMKMEVKHKKFFDLFEKYDGFKTGQLKLKRPKQLQEVLDIARYLLAEIRTRSDPEIEEKKSKLEQLKSVLEMYGYFSGINRKVQLKYQPKGRPRKSSEDDDVSGSDADVDTYPGQFDMPRDPSLVLILKWGGELTPAGKTQAEQLGKAFRCMYPGGQGDYNTPGLGLLRLHSTFRHDLKIYASDEGRVQTTAAAFAKGLLALEGELTPILVQMVKSANMNGLLDNDNESSKYQNNVKEKLRTTLHQDHVFTEDDINALAPTNSTSLTNSLKFIKNPVTVLKRVHELIHNLVARIKKLKEDLSCSSKEKKLYHGESWELLLRRWAKLEKDFKLKNGMYDVSKIPDVYDCIKYDLQHNQKILKYDQAEELYACSKALADIVIPQEYGITKEEKLKIAKSVCTPLLKKILADLQRNADEDSTRLDSRYSKGVASPHRHVKTRLYFTSESHIHSLMTTLRYGGLGDNIKLSPDQQSINDEQWQRAMDYVAAVSEFNYMSQIVIMLYEDPNKDPDSDERFHVELHFSPGAVTKENDIIPAGSGYRPHSRRGQQKAKEPEAGRTTVAGVANSSIDDQVFQPTPAERVVKVLGGPAGSPRGASDHDLADLPEEPEDLKSPNSSKGPLESAPDVQQILHSTTETALDDQPIRRVESEPITIDVHKRKRHHSHQDSATASAANSLTEDNTRDLRSEANSYESRRHSFDENLPMSLERKNSADMIKQHPLADSQHRHSFAGLFAPYITEPINKGSRTSLISTRVIRGSSSAPNLMDGFDTPGFNITDSQAPMWANIPAIRPLETLHNALTLRQIEEFFQRMTNRTPGSSTPRQPSTPGSYYNPKTVSSPGSMAMHVPVQANVYSVPSSTCSSSGPSSPTAASNPDDIMLKLKELIKAEKSKVPETNKDGAESDTLESPRT